MRFSKRPKGPGLPPSILCCGNIIPMGSRCPTCHTNYGAGGVMGQTPAVPSHRRSTRRKQEVVPWRPSTRTFVINSVSFLLVVFIVITVMLLMAGGGQ